MICNATLLRVDGPPPDPQGAPRNIRCALTPPTVEQSRISAEAGWGATAVSYIALSRVPTPRPATGGFALYLPDGAGAAQTLYVIKEVIQRDAPRLGHIVLYLAPAPS